MEHFYQLGWTLDSAGGQSGEAYKAEQNGERLFLKRNASPFLAALSAEGIVPKLLWTKRIETGEVVAAQDWKNGRSLTEEEMKSSRVAEILNKIHHSNHLLVLLKKMNVDPITPSMLLNEINQSMSAQLLSNETIIDAVDYLNKFVPSNDVKGYTLCHGDVNHNNWLLSEQDELFLIDWEGAMIADPSIDVGMVLYNYVPYDEWKSWFEQYDFKPEVSFLLRMKWYAILQGVTLIIWNAKEKRYQQMNQWIQFVDDVLTHNINEVF